jgi:hypothetical protein
MRGGLKIYQKEIFNKNHPTNKQTNTMFQEIKKEIESFGFTVVSHDFERPWGGFLVIDETQAQDFSNKFFEGLDVKIGRAHV